MQAEALLQITSSQNGGVINMSRIFITLILSILLSDKNNNLILILSSRNLNLTHIIPKLRYFTKLSLADKHYFVQNL